jgi:hypothetical protein
MYSKHLQYFQIISFLFCFTFMIQFPLSLNPFFLWKSFDIGLVLIPHLRWGMNKIYFGSWIDESLSIVFFSCFSKRLHKMLWLFRRLLKRLFYWIFLINFCVFLVLSWVIITIKMDVFFFYFLLLSKLKRNKPFLKLSIQTLISYFVISISYFVKLQHVFIYGRI